MPYVRRRRVTRRRTTLRRRPRMLRRRPIYRRRSSLRVHHFKRTFSLTPIQGAITDQLGAQTFRFDQLPNYTEFTELFDCYRINKIVVKFVPTANSSNVGEATTNPLTQFHTVLDFNDGNIPASLNSLYEYGNWKMTRGSSIHTRVFTPSILMPIQQVTAGTQFGAPKYKQWISTQEPDTYLYGLKYCAAAQVTAQDINWTPYVTLYFSCKSVK